MDKSVIITLVTAVVILTLFTVIGMRNILNPAMSTFGTAQVLIKNRSAELNAGIYLIPVPQGTALQTPSSERVRAQAYIITKSYYFPAKKERPKVNPETEDTGYRDPALRNVDDSLPEEMAMAEEPHAAFLNGAQAPDKLPAE
jgi:hypothetical protein